MPSLIPSRSYALQWIQHPIYNNESALYYNYANVKRKDAFIDCCDKFIRI